ncbi:MAG: murein transglycosylase A [Sulfurospirillaceae bacterium]|nr:murein transglycosylase A [Sulfurospirillaceae bacterium]
MRYFLFCLGSLSILFWFVGCATQKPTPSSVEVSLNDLTSLDQFGDMDERENFDELLMLFQHNCQAIPTQQLYPKACEQASHVKDAKAFFRDTFRLKKIEPNEQRSMLTGYYEPLLKGSLTPTKRFKYPIYATPKDLVVSDKKVDGKPVRGRLEKGKLVPYYTRAQITKQKLKAQVLCYVDDKIDLYFLEVQGSGRVELEDGRIFYVGYANTNGHSYHSLGREMVNRGIFKSAEDVSLQSIKAWLLKHPERTDALLNTNPSYVFFRMMSQTATGSLGLVLTPERSVAVDKRFIPLGALLAIRSHSSIYHVEKFVFAQDTGGAIQGPNRADMFMGHGEYAMKVAGELKAPLEVWMMEPKF